MEFLWILAFVLIPLMLLFVRPPHSPTRPPVVSGGILQLIVHGPLHFFSAGSRLGNVFSFQILTWKVTCLVGSSLAARFFEETDRACFSQQEAYIGFSRSLFGRGVIFDIPLHKRLEQFRFFSEALGSSRLKVQVHLMVQETERFVTKWGTEGALNLKHEIECIVMRTATSCLLGVASEELYEKITELILDLEHGFTVLSCFLPKFPILAHQKRDRARKELEKIFSGLAVNAASSSVLNVLKNARYRSGDALSKQDIASLMIAAIVGGQHTSSVTATWTGFHLLAHPDYLHEVMSQLPRDGCVNFEDLGRMSALQNSVKEALRLHAPTLLLRYCVKDVAIEDNNRKLIIPKGHYVALSPAFSHRLAELYENPESFIPIRWEQQFPKSAYSSFGGGRRVCLGEQFAFAQVKAIWAVLLKKFELQLVSPTMPKLDWTAMIPIAKEPILVHYKLRS